MDPVWISLFWSISSSESGVRDRLVGRDFIFPDKLQSWSSPRWTAGWMKKKKKIRDRKKKKKKKARSKKKKPKYETKSANQINLKCAHDWSVYVCYEVLDGQKTQEAILDKIARCPLANWRNVSTITPKHMMINMVRCFRNWYTDLQ